MGGPGGMIDTGIIAGCKLVGGSVMNEPGGTEIVKLGCDSLFFLAIRLVPPRQTIARSRFA
jgi:hypothetical protein